MQFDHFIKLIPKITKSKLPAKKAQAKMAPSNRLEYFDLNQFKNNARKAAVLCLFYPDKHKEIHFVLILRKTYKGVHSAQVGFPGGKIEVTDSDAKCAALRETTEEIGVKEENIVVFKELTQVYIPPSNFLVTPFLGYLELAPHFIKDDYEVEKIITLPLSSLLKVNNTKIKKVETSYGITLEVPIFRLNDVEIWGATAMMLSEIKDLVLKL